jgi:hypothetical protein
MDGSTSGNYDTAMRRKPKIVSVMLANNETGVLQNDRPLAKGAVLAPAFTPMRCRPGKDPGRFSSPECGRCQRLDVSAHKIGGPKGAAALVLDKRVDLEPLIAGGGHERGLRSGNRKRGSDRRFRRGLRTGGANGGLPLRSQLLKLREQLEGGLLGLGPYCSGRPPSVCRTQLFCRCRNRWRNAGRASRPGRLRGCQRRCLFECQSGAFACAAGDGRSK